MWHVLANVDSETQKLCKTVVKSGGSSTPLLIRILNEDDDDIRSLCLLVSLCENSANLGALLLYC